jgi:hypothetical protein
MATIIGLVIVAIIGFFVAQDANKRGMNGPAWGFGIFLLCIIFLPLYLIVRKPLLSDIASPPLPKGRPRLCSSCGKYYEGTAAFCPLCGAAQGVSS